MHLGKSWQMEEKTVHLTVVLSIVLTSSHRDTEFFLQVIQCLVTSFMNEHDKMK